MYVALLRGINVGGHNKLPMKELSALFEKAECHSVRTYIQSGNVIFDPGTQDPASLPSRITDLITERFGYQIPVVLRSAQELKTVVENNPFAAEDFDPKTLLVAFLAQKPTADAVAGLDPDRSPPDRFVVRGQEIYVNYPDGVRRSKLTNAYFDSKLGTISTARNWRTTLKLLELAQGP